MTHDLPDTEASFVAAAAQALRTDGGAAALGTLGWCDLLARLDDDELRTAVFALFRAQGRELAGSPALGLLLAQPFVAGTAIAPGTVVATLTRDSPRRGPVRVVVGDVDDRALLVDVPGRGAFVVDADACTLAPLDVPGGLPVHEVTVDPTGAPAIAEDDAARARERSTFLGRVALGTEMLGAAETVVDLAVAYAGDREQFGQPIGRFQAVRHLLAWARTDCVAVDAVVREAVALDTDAPSEYGAVVKALAGRNGRRACERALQAFGGIGFTAEHDHHRFHARVLLLDALLGSSADLTHELGTWVRTAGTAAQYPTTTLLGRDR